MTIAAFINEHEGNNSVSLLVEGAHCAACIRSIEGRLREDPLVREARLNLSLRRLSLKWAGPAAHGEKLAARIEDLGYRIAPFDPGQLSRVDNAESRTLLKSMALAAFASSNVMMLSLAVWAGQSQDMTLETQRGFQWLAALVAVPATLVAGQIFFRSAWRALRVMRTNIDVPISLGILLTTAISLMELLRGGEHVYFDSAIALLFVLLTGRYLDFRVRARARSSIEQLLLAQTGSAQRLLPDGSIRNLRTNDIRPGMMLHIPPGAHFPVDCIIRHGQAAIDRSVVTGESTPCHAAPGDRILSGSVNGNNTLQVEALASADNSHLARVAALIDDAETNRGRMVSLSDHAATLWTPLIHGAALITMIGWLLAGADVPVAILHAVCVLIVACPCAIGLAVPAVQTVASAALFRRGILLRSGEALERFARINTVVFDKTGTLTHAVPALIDKPSDPQITKEAALLASASNHPLAKAIAALHPGPVAKNVTEHPGLGLSQGENRLGSALFCNVADRSDQRREDSSPLDGSIVWFTRPGQAPASFHFANTLKPHAASVIHYFDRQRISPFMLSGDTPLTVSQAASATGIHLDRAHAQMQPADKLHFLEKLKHNGLRPLMVGDGVNDAPAMAAAWASAGFSHGTSVSQNRADLILPDHGLQLLPFAHSIALKAHRLVLQNFGLAVLYNIILMPLAMAGALTPLKAAIAMSVSSLTVTLNALRAGRVRTQAAT